MTDYKLESQVAGGAAAAKPETELALAILFLNFFENSSRCVRSDNLKYFVYQADSSNQT